MILLQALLKLLGFISMGGEVRSLLAGGGIKVNGEPEDRRGRKLRNGDIVDLPDGTQVRIVAEFE
ncbi:RNA-binding S4 domain-containing protein [bacterium]|nr:MAG: RNA-binding S4 domain-containing protein [bacterium]